MAGKAKNRWPKWNEPATKGDIVRSMVYIRSCIVDTFVCLSALSKNDMAGFRANFEDLRKSDQELKKLIDEIGGDAADE